MDVNSWRLLTSLIQQKPEVSFFSLFFFSSGDFVCFSSHQWPHLPPHFKPGPSMCPLGYLICTNIVNLNSSNRNINYNLIENPVRSFTDISHAHKTPGAVKFLLPRCRMCCIFLFRLHCVASAQSHCPDMAKTSYGLEMFLLCLTLSLRPYITQKETSYLTSGEHNV